MSASLSAKSSCCAKGTISKLQEDHCRRIKLTITPGKVPCLHAKSSRRCLSIDVSGPALSGLPF